jgi:hypothetical protein
LRRLVDQLTDDHRRLDALSVGDRSVRSSIGLSHHALDARPRRLFRLLGALTETDVPVWVAGALLDLPEPEAEDLIEDLVDARLVEARGPYPGICARCGMHSLVRLYARERHLAEDQDADRPPPHASNFPPGRRIFRGTPRGLLRRVPSHAGLVSDDSGFDSG